MIIYLVVFLIFILILWIIFTYNKIITLNNLVKEAWSGIDVFLKNRHDLIPNLLETVKGYAKHEKKLFEDIAELRTKAINTSKIEKKGEYEIELQDSLKSLFALAEAYPELKANQNFLDFQKSLTKIEDQLQYARRYYNGTVRNLNITLETFPNNILTQIFSFAKKDFFQVEEEDRKNIKV